MEGGIVSQDNNAPARELPSQKQYRAGVMKLQEVIENIPGALVGDSPAYLKVCPLKHTFVDKGYVREIFLPKNMLCITKIHKKTHPYFIMSGDVSVLTEDGPVRIKAPYHGITKAGTKRIIYIHEDTVWITVHSTEETDLEKIEAEIIAKDFDDMDNVIEIPNLMSEVEQ